MARQTGLLKIKGTLDNVTFYQSKDGHMAKMKTSLDGDRIKNDPTFARTRENGSEFGSIATSGKLFRDSLRNITANAADKKLITRVTQLMSKIKNLDLTSIRGARNVGVGIGNTTAKALLKGFEFNSTSILASILYKPYALNTTTGVITITGLVPATDIVFPPGATHVSITGGYANLNFVTGVVDFKLTNVTNLAVNAASSVVTLTPTAVPAGTGTKIFLLKIEFFQLVNGVQYSLKNGSFNALKVIEVL
ncbi:MAG: hypothetical protein HYR91_09605 [Flavobacteriia bacterium]|nr:hypothetical protein [Flavobacteriia bacterium]